jgi:hypothetical protein
VIAANGIERMNNSSDTYDKNTQPSLYTLSQVNSMGACGGY